MPNPNEVNKSMSPEELTIVANIESLIGELKAKSGGVQKTAPDQKVEDETTASGQQLPPAAGVMKDQVTTPSDGVTARDPAAQRIEGVEPEVDLENIDEVMKSFKAYLAKQQAAKAAKSVDGGVNGRVIAAIGEIAKVVKEMHDEQTATSSVLGQMLDGMGVAKQLDLMEKQNVNRATPITNGITPTDASAFIQQVRKELGQQAVPGSVPPTAGIQYESKLSQQQVATKNLENYDILRALTDKFTTDMAIRQANR